DYASNDHVALQVDLPLLREAGYDVVSLAELVYRFRAQQSGRAPPTDARCVAITFDDGPEYDAVDHMHPTLGMQRSFLGILQDFAQSPAGKSQRGLCATSFVIASPAARKVMEDVTSPDSASGPYYLHAGAMNDAWWSPAIDSGLLSIANHSWDHLHPALARTAHSRQAKADFTQVDNAVDADAQIRDAARYIDEKTGGRASPFFAYPFGQYNRFLVEDYLPNDLSAAGIEAAVTVDGRPLHITDSIWTLPRFSCGYNWTSPAELRALLNAA
ncbi:MAG TPA: polysaccharide deacetylase family protein, partial [Casimicrobiaceae bacterium]|nr:polysaccharide deacetylase family protein [Casimicrobiaceae bacterium]